MSNDMITESVASFDTVEVSVMELQQRLTAALELVPEKYRSGARIEVERFGDEWSGEYLQYHVTYLRPRSEEEKAASQTFLQLMPSGEIRIVCAGVPRFMLMPEGPNSAAKSADWKAQAADSFARYKMLTLHSSNGIPYAAGFELTAGDNRSATISRTIRSANFVEGVSGWELSKDGSLRIFG